SQNPIRFIFGIGYTFYPFVFFFKQKTAYEIGLGIPAEPLFRSSTEGVYCSRCVYYGKHQSFQATAGLRDYAPNAYSSSNGWSVFYQWPKQRNEPQGLW